MVSRDGFVPPMWAWPEEFLKLQENSCNCWTQYPLLCYHFFSSTLHLAFQPIFSVSLSSIWFYVKISSLKGFCFTYPSLPQAVESVQFLCKVQGLDSVMELYRQHMGQLLDWLSASVNTWSSYSPQRLQLHIIVIQSGEKWSLNVHKTLPNSTTGAEVCTNTDAIMVKDIQ